MTTATDEKLTPTQLVAEINECFSAFDNITHKFGIEKIKTIGDAYMAAGADSLISTNARGNRRTNVGLLFGIPSGLSISYLIHKNFSFLVGANISQWGITLYDNKRTEAHRYDSLEIGRAHV